MLTEIQTHLFNTFITVSYYGLIYFGILGIVYSADSANSNRIKTELTNSSPKEPLSTVSDPILQTDQTSVARPSQQESPVDLSNHGDSLSIIQYDDTPVPYKHEFWPSPRPVNFVKAILDDEPNLKVNGRLAHVKAVDILAERASMSRKEFLRTNPITYSERYMKGMNALYLLKDSIDRLEHLLLQETYKQNLRRYENGKSICPVY